MSEPRFGPGRVLLLLVTSLQLVAAAIVLGRPDVSGALTFFAGGWPTVREAIAAVEVLVWLLLIGAFILAAWLALTRGVTIWDHRRRRNLMSGTVLAIGVVVLLTGAVRHVESATLPMGPSGSSNALVQAERELSR